LQGGIGERGFGWRRSGLSEAVVLRSESRKALRSEGLMRCPGRGGHVPRIQGPYRLSGSARLPGASPGAGVPSVLSGVDLGPVLRLAGSSPRSRFRSKVDPPGEVRAQALEALGRQPSLVAPKRGARDQSAAVRGAADLTRGRPACLLPPGLAAGADRASRPPLSSKRTR
jgi:hypothetical protein